MKKLFIAAMFALLAANTINAFFGRGCCPAPAACATPCAAPACEPVPPICTKTVMVPKTIHVPQVVEVPARQIRIPQADIVERIAQPAKEIRIPQPPIVTPQPDIVTYECQPDIVRYHKQPDLIRYECPVGTNENPGC